MQQVALITGASSGIGEEFARIHAAKKRDAVLIARSEDKLLALKEALEKKHGITVLVIAKDLSLPNAPQEVYDELKNNSITVDYLINNAGFGDSGFFHETNWEKERAMIDLNMKTLTHFTKLFGSEMVTRKKGKILNVASTAAFQAGPLMSIYYATKHYVLAFSIGIANEWKAFGVSVTALCPGPTKSNFQNTADVAESKLFNNNYIPSARKVAKYGYKAMEKGKTIAIHGFMNKLLVFFVRFLPRTFSARLARKIQETR